MGFTVQITGITQVVYNEQGVLHALVADEQTGQTPTGLQYNWEASDGSFVGSTNGSSVTYRANIAQNADQAVTITCEVTLPGNPNPTVSAPSLTAMTELGITGQLVNMLITTEVSGAELFDRTDNTVIASGSDTELTSGININRIQWHSNNRRLTLNRSGTGAFRDFWDAAARGAYSAYFIVNDGTVVELPGAWIDSTIGSGYMRWDVPASETSVINAINSIASGQMMLFGIADTGSIGIPDETASADATVNVQVRRPPIDGGLLIVQPVSIGSIHQSTGVNNRDRIFDGDATTDATITQDNADITIDMGSPVMIGAIRIKTAADSPLGLVRIQPSDSVSAFPEADRSNYAPGEGEWHVYRFGNISRRYWRLQFLRRGTTNYQIAQIEFHRVVAAFDKEETRPANISARQYVPRTGQYRRYDRRLVSNTSASTRTELTVQWERLAQEHVDALEVLYRSGDRFTVIPDVEFAPDQAFRMRWASPFAFTDSTRNWELGKSGRAVFQEVREQLFRPVVQIEIEGQDVTGRWDPNDGMALSRSLDQQRLFRFQSGEVTFSLDNFDRHFDYGNANNFFVANNLPAHGRGGKVLIRVGLSADTIVPMFAGIISKVATSLNDTKAEFTLHDLSVPLSNNQIDNFGQTLTRKITDFDDAALFYNEFNPVFNIPAWGLPISRGSVAATILEDGTEVPLNIVDAVATQGTLSNRNIEIDYTTGQIRFEAEPRDGVDAQITVTWKTDHRHKRPDTLIRLLLAQAGIDDRIGISSAERRHFAIEQSLVQVPNRTFSSHGRPHPQESGVVRWLRRDDSAGTPVWQMIQDAQYIEYDEYQDEYTKVATLPTQSGLSGVVPDNYGELLASESFVFTDDEGNTFNPTAIAVNSKTNTTRIYAVSSHNGANRVYPFLIDGSLVESEIVSLPHGSTLDSLAFYNGKFYAVKYGSGNAGINIYNASDGTLDSSLLGSSTIFRGGTIAVSPSRIFIQGVTRGNNSFIGIYDHNGANASGESTLLINAIQGHPNSIAVNETHIFGWHYTGEYRVTTLSYVRDETMDIDPTGSTPSGVAATNTRLYVSQGSNLSTYNLGTAINFGAYVPYQFSTIDGDTIYFLCANNTQGNAVSSSTLRRIKVYKLVKSTGVWTDLLNSTTGQPQLSHAYKIGGNVTYLADNRKNFQVIRRNNKTLVFYRRVQATQSGVAYYNDNDGSITDVYSEAHSGSIDYGLPYSMDFALDVRSDGIYVYTFVVHHELNNNSTFNTATLKIYRKRVEPNGTQTEIYSETFTGTSAEEDYPVSVSDLILADNRSKFYFTLDFHGEGDRPGKAELCTIAKSGSGSRAVLKTYDNPLVSARSPAERQGSYFYLEGGWVRPDKDDPLDTTIPADQHHYPNAGGHLIEINTDDTITDHGIVWRSATKLDSPDPDEEDGVFDGYGRHNGIISNMFAGPRGNLHFVAGYGSPYNISENLPFSSNREPVPDLSNYHWLQWGHDLATKIQSFPTRDAKSWELIQRLAAIMNWEVGFGPSKLKVDSVQDGDSTISDWSANASLFFRPRTILPATLRTHIGSSGTPQRIALNNNGLPTEVLEFPNPPADQAHTILIDKELFTYTAATPDTAGVVLTGITRSRHDSDASAHRVDTSVYFVDAFVSGEIGTSLVALEDRAPDFVQLYNNVNVGFSDTIYNTKNQLSIDEHEEFALNIDAAQPLLSQHDAAWAEVTGDTYLALLSQIRELIQFSMVFSPSIHPGQLVVFHQTQGVSIEYTPFRVLRVNPRIPAWQTSVVAKEI